MYCSQKLGEDFAKFCGLLRIYELYNLIDGSHCTLYINNQKVHRNLQTQLIVFHEFDEAMKCDLFLFYRFWEEWGGILGRAVFRTEYL